MQLKSVFCWGDIQMLCIVIEQKPKGIKNVINSEFWGAFFHNFDMGMKKF